MIVDQVSGELHIEHILLLGSQIKIKYFEDEPLSFKSKLRLTALISVVNVFLADVPQ